MLADSDPSPRAVAAWRPRRVLATKSAREWEHGRAILRRAAALGIEITELPGDRLALGLPDDPRRAYAEAKATLAVVVAPPSKRKLQPIAPSADWRIDLAEGCPAHCSYCYLAGSLSGPPITRVYANLEEILAAAPNYLGQGKVTSRSAARAHEGTTYEASCYTDPLGIEALTGSLSAAIAWFGRWDAPVQLRFTTKFADVEPLLGLAHAGRTRMRASVNPRAYARFEGGTAPVAQRLAALRRMALAGYPVGLTIAPIIAAEGWQQAWRADRGCRRCARRHPGARPDGGTHHAPLHRWFESSSRQLVSRLRTGHGRREPGDQTHQVRYREAGLRCGDHARAAHLLRVSDRPGPTLGAGSLLDMTTFFTADTHFGDHRTINIWRRPFTDSSEMDAVLVERWNATVSPDDEVAPGRLRQARRHGPRASGAATWPQAPRARQQRSGSDTSQQGWASVRDYIELPLDGHALVLCHYPFRSWNAQHRGSINLHGHSHGRLKPIKRQFDVGSDVHAFAPVTLEQLLASRGS